jgi:hypothetical protein
MPMEAATVDKLVEKAKFDSETALAVAEAMDIAIKAANLATVKDMDVRFAQVDVRFAQVDMRFTTLEAKMDTRFAIYLYAALTIALFSALAVDHHWLVSREDQLIAQVQARSDQLIAQAQARSDQLIAQAQAHSDQLQARSDQRFEAMQARSDQRFEAMEARMDQHRQQKPVR